MVVAAAAVPVSTGVTSSLTSMASVTAPTWSEMLIFRSSATLTTMPVRVSVLKPLISTLTE